MRIKNILYSVIIIIILTLLAQNIVYKQGFRRLQKKYDNFREDVQTILIVENRNIPDIDLTDHLGKKFNIKALAENANSQKLLVLFFPKCICGIEKEKVLFKADSLFQIGKLKNLIIVFEELDYHKLMQLKRLHKFSCPMFCDTSFKLNISDNKNNRIFLFQVDRELKYKNLLFADMSNGDYLELVNIYNPTPPCL